jgi:hypothetical protein
MRNNTKSTRPFSCPDKPSEFSQHSEPEQRLIKLWISFAIRPAKTKHWRTSYGLKHDLERDTGLYVTNPDFKGAMLAMGYDPVDPWALNWHFRIRPASRRDRLKHGVFNLKHLPETAHQELQAAIERWRASWEECQQDKRA